MADGAKGFVYSSDSNILAKESYEDDAKKKARVQGLNVYDDSLFGGGIVCVCVCVCVCMYVCMYVCVRVCACLCVCVYTYIMLNIEI